MENETTVAEYIDDDITEALVRTVATYQWEKILLFLYGTLLLLGGTLANSLVLFLTAKHKKFHEAYMYIRAAYAVVDIIFAWGTVPIVLINLFFEDVPPWVSCYFGDIGVGMFLCTVHLTALISLERYFFFCHPLKYHRIFNLKTIACTCTAMIILTQAYMLGTEVLYGRQMQFVLLLCQLDDAFHNTLQVTIWYIPSVVIVVFSIVSIQRMITSLANSEVLPASQDTLEPRLRRKAGRKAIKLILLVSGAFWITCLPIYLFRTIILSMGYTWDQLNHYDNILASSTMRIGQFTSALTVILDPVIYFGVNPDLRKAFRKSFGLKEVAISEVS